MHRPRPRALFCGALIVTWLCTFPNVVSSQAQNPESTAAAATLPYGGCPAPSTAGVKVCEPFIYSFANTIASPFQLIASGTGSRGPVRLMEVWADGHKIAQTYGYLFDAPIKLPTGSHQLTVVELDDTGAYRKSAPFIAVVQSSTAGEVCDTPSTPGVNVCNPGIGGCHTGPWDLFVASGRAAHGTVVRMELWVNGYKLANFPGNYINTNLYLADYSQVTIVEVDSTGGYIKSPVMTLQAC